MSGDYEGGYTSGECERGYTSGDCEGDSVTWHIRPSSVIMSLLILFRGCDFAESPKLSVYTRRKTLKKKLSGGE